MPPQADKQLVIQTLKALNKRRIVAQTAKRVLVLQKRRVDQEYDQRISKAQRQVMDTNLRIQRELTAHKDLLGIKSLDDE